MSPLTFLLRENILEDPVFIVSGDLSLAIHTVKNSSQTNTTTHEVLRTHSNFKAKLPPSYVTPAMYKFRFHQVRKFDHYGANASKNLKQLSFWQTERIRFFQFQFNFLNKPQHDLETKPIDNTNAPSRKKLHHQTYQLCLEQKHP